jgi:hypothetical protein
VTQCEKDGSFCAKQCYFSTGYCWCVDTSGKEIEYSRRREWESGKLNCEAVKAAPCFHEHAIDIQRCQGMIGCQVAQCDKDGTFSAKQCSGSTGYCWCVDVYGVEIKTSKHRVWESEELNCEAMRDEQRKLSKVKDIPKTDECLDDEHCPINSKCLKGKCICRTACPRIYLPVCASNGETYPSKCVMEAEACENKLDIFMVHEEECGPDSGKLGCNELECPDDQVCVVEDDQGQCRCIECTDDVSEPVCGSDGQTYRNKCTLRATKCKEKRPLRVLHEGECEETPEFEVAGNQQGQRVW